MAKSSIRAAAVACAVLFTLGGEEAVATSPVTHPPPPNYGIIGMNWYMNYTGSKGATKNPYRQLWPAGGVIPLQGSDWLCEHTAVATEVVDLPVAPRTNAVYRVPQDTVDLKCTYDGRSVTASVSCLHRENELDSTFLQLRNADGKSFYVDIQCAYLKGKQGSR